MRQVSDREWMVLEALWKEDGAALGTLAEALRQQLGWNKNTVFTYLSRMEAKGLVAIDRGQYPHLYRAAVSEEDCRAQERGRFLQRVYHGSTGDLVTAFLREKPVSPEERDALRRLLDEMEGSE